MMVGVMFVSPFNSLMGFEKSEFYASDMRMCVMMCVEALDIRVALMGFDKKEFYAWCVKGPVVGGHVHVALQFVVSKFVFFCSDACVCDVMLFVGYVLWCCVMMICVSHVRFRIVRFRILTR